MSSDKCDDHTKFGYALLSRDVRRLTSMFRGADLDAETRNRIDGALVQLEARVWMTFVHDPVKDVLIQDENHYSDGRPVTTTIAWGDGYATLVHCPNPAEGTSDSEAEELSPEMSRGE